MSPTASPETIRAAYRDRARLAHPDRGGTSSDTMVAINEAYRVLADPGRRAVYDRALRTAAAGAGDVDDMVRQAPDRAMPDRDGERRATPLSPSGPARVPWRLMAAAAAVGSAIVLVSSLFDDSPTVEQPDGLLRPGSCVAFESNGDVREIACGADGADIVVELMVPLDGTCPTGTVGHRDRLGLGIACVAT